MRHPPPCPFQPRPRVGRVLACAALLATVGATAAHLGGCTNEEFDPESFTNAKPIARIFLSGSPGSGTESYNRQTFYWSGTDRDGFIVGFHVAIGTQDTPPTQWIFTAKDESTATYTTDAAGRAWPRLYVVAQDDRGALSDTAAVTFPLQNFPPSVVLKLNFRPPVESFGAASFELVGFDADGDETLQQVVDYRYEGSNPDLVFLPGDPSADPTLGWVRQQGSPTAISLVLRNIPPASPQRVYARIVDEAGASGVFQYEWTVHPVVGKILLLDDCIHDTRDAFYRDALTQITGGQFSVWNIAGGLPAREGDVRLTFQQFPLLLWYTSNSPSSDRLRLAQPILTEYLTTLDVDPVAAGVQHGKLLLEDPVVFGNAGLSSTFRTNILGIQANLAEPRAAITAYNSAMEAAIGPLDIAAQDALLPDLVSVGQNYQGGAGRYFGLYGLTMVTGTAALYRFEPATQWSPADAACRVAPGCSPLVATRRPATGLADVVLLAFQLEWANAAGNSFEALRVLIEGHLGITTP